MSDAEKNEMGKLGKTIDFILNNITPRNEFLKNKEKAELQQLAKRIREITGKDVVGLILEEETEKSPRLPGMKAVFLGTPDLSVPSLEAVLCSHDVRLVVTQPDRPRGRARPNTISVSTAPDSSAPIWRPTMVTTGSREFRNPCRITTLDCELPLARAVLTKSRPITSSRLDRVMRAITANGTVPSTMVGRMR